MVYLALVCSALMAASPADPPAADVLDDYRQAAAHVGRDAEAHVKLALWCEAHGLQPERLKHLAIAVLTDPANTTARGLMGLVAYRGRWETPDAVGERLKDDEALAALREEYNRRRAEVEGRPEPSGQPRRTNRSEAAQAHAKLALWCEQVGLKDEATAHLTTAVVLDPYRDATWKHLGYVKHGGRWMSREQVEAERRDADEQRRADRRWEPLLRKWRGWLAEDSHRDEAEGLLATVDDPRAVPSIVRVFRVIGETDQARAVQLLGRIDAPSATRELASLAVFSRWPWVRSAAARTLRGRPPRDYAGPLVDLIRSPMKYRVMPVGGPGSPGALEVETPRFRMLRTYDAPPAFQFSSQFYGYVGYDANGLPVVARGAELKRMAREGPSQVAQDLARIEARTAGLLADAQLKAVVSQQRLAADIHDIEAANAETAATNERVVPVLAEALDAPADLKDDEDAWHTWYYDQLGYRYDPPAQVTAVVNASPQYPPPRIASCFVAGTPVRTPEGHRPIEALAAGDRVLTQDVAAGELSFQPVLVVHHNPPGKTIRVELDDGEVIVASVYHRFWRAGRGWAMARELKPGDTLRTLGGTARVVSATSGSVEPVFNLDVARTRTFFVGLRDALVHDNTLPDLHKPPFDAPPVLARVIPSAKE